MRTRITFIFFILSIVTISAQDRIPNKEELFGEWQLVLGDFRSRNTKYILFSGRKNLTRNDVTRNDFPIGAKIIISEEGIIKKYILGESRCGNDHRRIHNRVYGKHKMPMVYNKSEGILELSSNIVFAHTRFSVRKLDSGNILLTKAE